MVMNFLLENGDKIMLNVENFSTFPKEDIKEENSSALPYNEIEKLKTEFMKNNR